MRHAYNVGMEHTLSLPDVEDRLQERYEVLVQEHTGHAHPVAAGPRHLPRHGAATAAQAAWRFYKNPRTKTTRLVAPLLDAARSAATSDCERFALVAADWSHLDYRTHADKRDRVQIGQKEELGYELFSQLLLCDRDGRPLAPLCLRLQAAAGMYSSQYDGPRPPQSQLDALAADLDYVAGLGLGKPVVSLIDAEADSVFHFRQWHPKHYFVVRVDEARLALFEDQELSLPAIADVLRGRHAFQRVRQVQHKGAKVEQYVAEAAVVLHRPGYLNRAVDGQRKRLTRKGPPLPLRLVVSELRRADGTVVARWLLLSNVPAEVSAATLALWYYWRWQIESFFKLLKGAGQQVEQWQQETGERILKRLLVASMACVLVWHLARSVAPQAKEARRLLVKLSGRQIEYGKEFTEEALLAGLWVLLAIVDTLENHLPQQLTQLAAFILGGSGTFSSA